MAQVLEFRLPDLGEGLTEAEIVRWLVQVGDVVAVDQPVVEVETAKALVDVPCPYGGVVTARFGEEGTELPVGAPLLTVAVGAPASDHEDEGSGNVLVGYGTGTPPARRGRVRPAGPADSRRQPPEGPEAGTKDGRKNGPTDTRQDGPGSAEASSPGGEADSGAGVEDRSRIDGPVPVISPLVRRLAREYGLDLRELGGSGPDGLILRADVEYAARAAGARGRVTETRTAPYAPVAPEPSAAPGTRATDVPAAEVPAVGVPAAGVPAAGVPAAGAAVPGTRIPLRGVRGAVADKLARSRREIPDATCWVDADATELMRARGAMNEAAGPKISVLALLARICTAALARFPELNATVDMEARELVRLEEVHLGFAAQTERGLVVPVVKDAHARDAESLSAEFARLTEAARTGTLTPGELTGGTFTLNNYGVFGVDGSTPIINHPEAAMLGVGRIVPKPWVHEGELAVRQVVQLSLTFDHRVCDGGTAGGFLRYVADCVEQPVMLLRSL
ncbi:dihydrolipoamide acetyltransferase family protein [Streptomyces sporangiiformans]|uniref:Dihydrolipoamide acetyltransferase component of pyruvate dehydrogenase complex n=1 Tax=Streptomyces sporangiiformans TaxID=2315329 RepID=A0A505D3Q5_9ACTN|nr:dihydrolipoamide acetyltransferase family protein [Streptomyces sporangiiformans]TPQ16265.1 2-oxo acid dehydrogenase subunit E2 [Streptomyces sporangiiformans]